ncbi:MAG: hypothetical protein E3J72_08505 [Planctomycetota bacterium]|nr:MAG: hypothetical protein E3J72_08505 [Planctomycetota bacterium]
MIAVKGSYHEFHFFFIIIFASLPVSAACAAWLLGRYYKISFMRRIIAVLSGWVFALCLTLPGLPTYKWGNITIYRPALIPVYAIIGSTVVLWLLTQGSEPAKFGRLFGASALAILVYSVAAFPVFALTIFINERSFVSAPTASLKHVRKCASTLRDLYSAQELYRNQHKKYGSLEDLEAGRFFETSRLDAGITKYIITMTTSDEKHWECIAVPTGEIPGAWSLRVDETGEVRYREDGRPPTPKDPVFR